MRDSVVLEAINVAVQYQIRMKNARGVPFKAVDDVTFQVRRGEAIGIVGESGAGKSTLARAICGLEPVQEGYVRLSSETGESASPAERKKIGFRIEMMFQDAFGSLDPRWTIRKAIMEPLKTHGWRSADAARRANEVAEIVALSPEMRARYPHQLSGGQRQRVAIARAIAGRPHLVVCDEPISGLDVSAQGEVINLLRRLRSEESLTYIFIGHNLAVMRLLVDELIVMYCGQVVETGPAVSLFENPGHPYTRALLASAPSDEPRNGAAMRFAPRGDVASPSAPPSGCRFHTRCWLHEALGRPAKCRDLLPPLSGAGEGRQSRCHFIEGALDPPGLDSSSESFAG